MSKRGASMTPRNGAVPLIAVVEGFSVGAALASAGAETFDVDTKAEAKLALTYADGIVLTGGGDVNPQRYNQKRHKEVYGVDGARDKLEFWLVKKARERGIPILGICRGSQVLNVAYGGTLNQEIYDDPTVAQHWGTELWVKLAHRSRLARSLGTMVLRSSHYHHQAVDMVGKGLRAIAWAQDGTIEAVESMPTNPHYVLGLQFHPEMDYRHDEDAMAVFEHFSAVCGAMSAKRKVLADERLASAELLRPVKFQGTYNYSAKRYGSYIGSEDDPYSATYLYGTRDDWDYQEWQELNNAGALRELGTLDEICEKDYCTTPGECSQYKDCGAAAIRAQKARLDNAEQWNREHSGYHIVDLKRGNGRGDTHGISDDTEI